MGDYVPHTVALPDDLKDQSFVGSRGTSSPFELPGASVPNTQKAVVTPTLVANLDARVTTIPTREPSPGEAVVRIAYSGICRSDVSFSKQSGPDQTCHDHIAGHEALGWIVKSYDSSLLGRKVGLRYVGVACRGCTYCLEGLPTSCPSMLSIPNDIKGTFQEYATVPTSSLIDLTDILPVGDVSLGTYAAALCSGSAALVALKQAAPRAGDVVIVIGIAGAIGHLTGGIAKQVFGAKVIGIDFGSKIQSLASRASEIADLLLPAAPGEHEEARSRLFSDLVDASTRLRRAHGLRRGAQSVIVTASTAGAFKDLDRYICDGGKIICVGVPAQTTVSIPVNTLIERNLKLSGNLMGGYEEAIEVMSYIQSGHIKPLITEVPLEDVPKQMQALADCEAIGKVVVKLCDMPCIK